MILYLLRPYVVVSIIIAVLVVATRRRRSKPGLPDLPLLNNRDGEWFSRLRARIRTTVNYKDAIHQGYHQVWSPNFWFSMSP